MTESDKRHDGAGGGLEDAFLYADDTRNKIEAAKKQVRDDPVELAEHVARNLPAIMHRLKERIATTYGVDVSNPNEALKCFKAHDYATARDFLHRLNTYAVYEELNGKLQRYAGDQTLSKEERAAKICELGIQAANAADEVYLHMLNEQRRFVESGGSEEAAKLARHEEGRRMAAHIATRTSLRRNVSLAKELDDIREYNGPAKRERFKALLEELYTEAPKAWDAQRDIERGAGGRLLSARTVVAEKIAGRSRPDSPTEVELAEFAVRERLLKRARDAGLPPREQELFGLVMREPGRFLRNGKLNHAEAARELGVAVGTTKSLWSRIKRTAYPA